MSAVVTDVAAASAFGSLLGSSAETGISPCVVQGLRQWLLVIVIGTLGSAGRPLGGAKAVWPCARSWAPLAHARWNAATRTTRSRADVIRGGSPKNETTE